MFNQRSTTKLKAASSFFKGRKGTPNKRIIKNSNATVACTSYTPQRAGAHIA